MRKIACQHPRRRAEPVMQLSDRGTLLKNVLDDHRLGQQHRIEFALVLAVGDGRCSDTIGLDALHQRRGAINVHIIREQLCQRSDRVQRLDVWQRQSPATNDGGYPRVFATEILRGNGRCCRRAKASDLVACGSNDDDSIAIRL